MAQYKQYRDRAVDDDLCEECAKYDWEYFFHRHLNPSCDSFDMPDSMGNSPPHLGFPGSVRCGMDPYKVEIKDKLHSTLYFDLCSLEAMIKSKDCSLCSLALSSITTLAGDNARNGNPGALNARPWQLYQLSFTISFRTQKIEDKEDRFAFYLLEESVATGDEARPIGRIIENEDGQVSQSTTQTWFTECETFHQDICVPSTNVPPVVHDDLKDDYKFDKIYVIDDAERRSDGQSYLPLDDLWEDIPNTLRDAAMVAKLLGKKHLWVDSLCIVQGCPAEEARMIEKMDQMYAKAVYCIVARSGKDADAGLGGLYPGPRHSEQIVGKVKGYKLVLARPPVGVADGYQLWRTRGWTFQEEKLSPRLVYFISDHAYHVCRCATWSEDLTEGSNTIGPVRYAWQENYDKTKPDQSLFLSQYGAAVAEYTPRSLTFPQDKIAAFAGFLNNCANIHSTRTC
ncbi:MAG: hypothetical protein MMC33_006985 [Icmadophila ericetorum]|nr:hypothetical protein [Icmadophila ericetorum]